MLCTSHVGGGDVTSQQSYENVIWNGLAKNLNANWWATTARLAKAQKERSLSGGAVDERALEMSLWMILPVSLPALTITGIWVVWVIVLFFTVSTRFPSDLGCWRLSANWIGTLMLLNLWPGMDCIDNSVLTETNVSVRSDLSFIDVCWASVNYFEFFFISNIRASFLLSYTNTCAHAHSDMVRKSQTFSGSKWLLLRNSLTITLALLLRIRVSSLLTAPL